MSEIIKLRGGEHFAIEAELADRIRRVVLEYEGRVSFVSAIGVLEVVKMELQQGQE